MEYIWFARIGFVLFSIGIDFFQFDNLYLRVCSNTYHLIKWGASRLLRYTFHQNLIWSCIGMNHPGWSSGRFAPPFYFQVIHDTAGHFIQSLFICTIYSFGKLDWIAFIPAVIASLIDIDHFYAARSFSIKSG